MLLNIFSDLAPIQIQNYAYNLVDILRKLGTSTSGTSCILHNSREATTIASYLNVKFYIKL
jgi:hypothetical protein